MGRGNHCGGGGLCLVAGGGWQSLWHQCASRGRFIFIVVIKVQLISNRQFLVHSLLGRRTQTCSVFVVCLLLLFPGFCWEWFPTTGCGSLGRFARRFLGRILLGHSFRVIFVMVNWGGTTTRHLLLLVPSRHSSSSNSFLMLVARCTTRILGEILLE